MAIGVPTVRGTATSTTSALTLVVTLGTGVGTGNMVFAAASARGSGNNLTSAIDSRGNTWTVDNVNINAGGNNTVGIASAPVGVALQAADTVTLTFIATPGPSMQAVVWSVSGLAASPLDQIADGAAIDTAFFATGTAGTTGVLAQADEIVFSCWVLGAPTPNNRVVGAGYTELQYLSSSGAASGDRPLWVQYRIVAATTAVSPDGSWTLNDFGGGIVGMTATYKGAAAAPGASAGKMLLLGVGT